MSTPYEQRLWDKWMDSELADLMKEEYAEKVAKYFIKKHREYVKETVKEIEHVRKIKDRRFADNPDAEKLKIGYLMGQQDILSLPCLQLTEGKK